MKKNACFVILCFVFFFSNSCKDELVTNSDLFLKSGKLKKDVVSEMKVWFESNQDANKFVLSNYTNEIKWSSALTMELDNSIVTEVKVILKGQYSLISEKDPSLNFDQRLLFIQKDGIITSYMEYLISKKDQSYLQDTEKASYLKKDGSFAGSIILETSKGEFSKIYYSAGDDNALRLKNVEMTCYELRELFSDGSYQVIALFGCNAGTGSGTHGSGGTPAPKPAPTPAPSIIEDPSFQNTTADCVKTKLESGSVINCLLEGFSLSTSTIDLTFAVADMTTFNGTCSPIVNGRTTITINTDRLNVASLELARIILHESFHAYLFGKLYDPKFSSGLLPEPNFQADFEAYRLKYAGQTQHNYIADQYISYMKSALSTYFNSETYKDTFCNSTAVKDSPYWYGTDWLFECLAWSGLKETDAWATFQADPEKKRKYDETMSNIAKLLPKEDCGVK